MLKQYKRLHNRDTETQGWFASDESMFSRLIIIWFIHASILKPQGWRIYVELTVKNIIPYVITNLSSIKDKEPFRMLRYLRRQGKYGIFVFLWFS